MGPYERAKKDLDEPDPALEFGFADCRALAEAPGARVPTWREWEAAHRGMQGRIWPWGDAAPDASCLTLRTLRGALRREDPESSMGMGRDAWTVDWSCRVVDDFVRLARTTTAFGLEGVVRWGSEWNVAEGSVLGANHEGLLRSFCDYGEERVSYDRWQASNPKEAYPSHHRAFRGRGLATCGTAARYPYAAFRLVI